MMGFFKKNEEVLDLTLLQKKGILKIREEKGDVDLTKTQTNSQIKATSSPFDFLDSLAQTSSTTTNNQSYFENVKPDLDLKDLKVKFEDIEYKLGKFIERLERIEEKLEEFKR